MTTTDCADARRFLAIAADNQSFGIDSSAQAAAQIAIACALLDLAAAIREGRPPDVSGVPE